MWVGRWDMARGMSAFRAHCTSGLSFLCFPQLWKHLKNSLRILFHHFFPKGEWAPTGSPGDVACPLCHCPNAHLGTLSFPVLLSLQTSNLLI